MVKIKICGVKSVADALAAARLGADAIGLNFYAPSPRCIGVQTAAAVIKELPAFVEPVGLFVNEPIEQMLGVSRRLGLRTLQVHRDRWEDVIDASPERLIPAFAVRDQDSLAAIRAYLEKAHPMNALPAAILVDAHVPGLHGGTGQTAPWDLLADFQPGVPLILAGGLTPENVAEAIRRVRPYGIDVASGVESCPGKKDEERMRRFIAELSCNVNFGVRRHDTALDVRAESFLDLRRSSKAAS